MLSQRSKTEQILRLTIPAYCQINLCWWETFLNQYRKELNKGSSGELMINKIGCISELSRFFEPLEQVKLQQLNKRVYKNLESVIYQCEHPVPPVENYRTVLLERRRTEFYLSRIENMDFDQDYWKLFSIGPEDKPDERIYSPATLGFEEIYFQFIVRMDDYTYYAWPLIEEAFINEGYKLTFSREWKLISSKKIANPPERLMRPTIMHIKRNFGGQYDLLFCGGTKEQHNFYYDTIGDCWKVLPMLPQGHNITCNVTCNWKDQAMFTFLLDGSLNLRCAVLDLQKMSRKQSINEQTDRMSWALTMDASQNPQADQQAPPFVNGEKPYHNIDRFHVKCATVMDDDQIVVCARGRYPGMREAVSTLFLWFKVIVSAENEYTLEMTEVQRCFPTVFPRQLDYMQRLDKNLILVQDVPDNDDFEVMAIMTDRKRERCGVNQIHKILTMNQEVKSPYEI